MNPTTHPNPRTNDSRQGAVAPSSPAQTAAERERIVLEHMPTIGYIVSRLARRLPAHVDLDDLHGAGALGLLDAAEKYDTSKNCRFKTYAEFRIKGAILDHLREMDWVPRSIRSKGREIERATAKIEQRSGRCAEQDEIAQTLCLDLESYHELIQTVSHAQLVSLESLGVPDAERDQRGPALDRLADPTSPDSFEVVADSERIHELKTAVSRLPEQERLVISLYYFEGLKMKEVGQVIGVTESRVCQVHSRATLRLRKLLDPSINQN